MDTKGHGKAVLQHLAVCNTRAGLIRPGKEKVHCPASYPCAKFKVAKPGKCSKKCGKPPVLMKGLVVCEAFLKKKVVRFPLRKCSEQGHRTPKTPKSKSCKATKSCCSCQYGQPPGRKACALYQISMKSKRPQVCGVCHKGYHKHKKACRDNICKCPNGSASFGVACTTDGMQSCQSCKFGYYKLGRQCKLAKCSCDNGVGVTGVKCQQYGGSGKKNCKYCNGGYQKACVGYHGRQCGCVPMPKCSNFVGKLVRSGVYSTAASLPGTMVNAGGCADFCNRYQYYQSHKNPMLPQYEMCSCISYIIGAGGMSFLKDSGAWNIYQTESTGGRCTRSQFWLGGFRVHQPGSTGNVRL